MLDPSRTDINSFRKGKTYKDTNRGVQPRIALKAKFQRTASNTNRDKRKKIEDKSVCLVS